VSTKKSQIQALDRTLRSCRCAGIAGASDPRLQTLRNDHLFAAFNILNGKVIGSCLPRHRGKEFRKSFSTKLEKQVPPDLDVHIIFGQLQHAQECHRKAVAQIPKAPPLLFPTSPHQQFLAQSGGTLLRPDHRTYDPRGTFRSVEELERAIYAWLANWNNQPQPFRLEGHG